MESCVSCLVEEGTKMLVLVNGYFSERLVEMGKRHRATVTTIKKPWGETFSIEEIKEAISRDKPDVVAVVHAETSTGAKQSLEGLGKLCHQNNSLLLVDTVTSLGGIPLFLDELEIDACYSGAQKNLNCTPGISPLSFSEKALQKIKERKTVVHCWYLDMSLIGNYWSGQTSRVYHHTAPVSLNYGLREALLIVAEEGLENVWKRVQSNAELFWEGLEKMGLELHVKKHERLPTLTTVKVPQGVDPKAVTNYFLEHFHIEIGNGLGELAGKVWRVGLFGFNNTKENVEMLLKCFKQALSANGFETKSNL